MTQQGEDDPCGQDLDALEPGDRVIVLGVRSAQPLRLVSPGDPPAPPPDDTDAAAYSGGEGDGPNNLLLSRHPRSDLGNADRLIARFGSDLMFVETVGWYAWDGQRWSSEGGDHAARIRAHETAKLIRHEAEAMEQAGSELNEDPKQFEKRLADHRRYSISSGNRGKIDGMLKEAEPYLRRPITDLDNQDYFINLKDVELGLGAPGFEEAANSHREAPEIQIGPHARERLASRIAKVSYDPRADCSRWRHFLQRILPDDELRLFIQRWFGYCLTGDVSEQVLLCCYGTGANGKSTLLEVVGDILGDYTVTVGIETFLHDDRKSGSQPTPDIVRLPGARLVLAAEPEVGARLSESTIKRITGGDKVTGRALFKSQFEFRPRFKLVISFNTKPTVRGQDEGIWRRLLMLPFTEFISPADRDRHLKDKLLAEAPGIFNWMLDGYRMWCEQGLNPPMAVKEATDVYRAESDPIGQFMEQMTARVDGEMILAVDMYVAYQSWCTANGLEPVTKNSLGRRLTEKGYLREKHCGLAVYRGIELRASSTMSAGQD